MINRSYGQGLLETRPLSIAFDRFGYADASVLFEIGATRVLASVTLQSGVPIFLKGQGVGWLSAEYAMLPTATNQRTQRESSAAQRNGRSVEISRLIGRSLRPVVNLAALGERTITIDCDVLQADGSTRVACITAAGLALARAVARWKHLGIVTDPMLNEPVAAVSVGIIDGRIYVDLDQAEDNAVEADFNFVLSASMHVIEIQGTAEKSPFAWAVFDQLKEAAIQGVRTMLQRCDEAFKNEPVNTAPLSLENRMPQARRGLSDAAQKNKSPLFSLEKRRSS